MAGHKKEASTKIKLKIDTFTFSDTKSVENHCFLTQIIPPDNLWNILKISLSGQSVGGQTKENDCTSLETHSKLAAISFSCSLPSV